MLAVDAPHMLAVAEIAPHIAAVDFRGSRVFSAPHMLAVDSLFRPIRE